MDGSLADFANLSAHSSPMAAAAGRKKQSTIHRPTLYIILPLKCFTVLTIESVNFWRYLMRSLSEKLKA
jgi:hypothetical protein